MLILLERIPLIQLPKTIGPAPSDRMKQQLKDAEPLQEPHIARVGDHWRIIDGNRRIAARRAAGATDILCKVITKATAKELAQLTLTLNYLRSPNYGTETQSVIELVKQAQDVKQIAEQTGMDTRSVEALKRYANANVELLEAFYEGHIAPTTMDKIVRCNPQQQEQLALVYSVDKKVTSGDVKRVQEAWDVATAPETAAPMLYGIDDDHLYPLTLEELQTRLDALSQRAIKTGYSLDKWIECCYLAKGYSL